MVRSIFNEPQGNCESHLYPHFEPAALLYNPPRVRTAPTAPMQVDPVATLEKSEKLCESRTVGNAGNWCDVKVKEKVSNAGKTSTSYLLDSQSKFTN